MAEDYPACLAIVEQDVKPERQRLTEKGEYVLRKPLPDLWWIYGEKRPGLYRSISRMQRTLCICRVSQTTAFVISETGKVFSDATIVIADDRLAYFAILQSGFHGFWALQYASSMKNDLRYTPSDIFETFPFPRLTPATEQELEAVGAAYHAFRGELMRDLHLGLTKTNNLFHTPDLTPAAVAKAAKLEDAARAAALCARLAQLRTLHRQLDEAVARAYGWADLPLDHGFHAQEYLPETDRTRYTISPAARREVLKRLLALNHARYAEEQAAAQAAIELAEQAKPKRKAKSTPTAAPQPIEEVALEPAAAPLFEAPVQPEEVPQPMMAVSHRSANSFFKRTVLAAEVAHHLHAQPTFGHVKMMKVVEVLSRHAVAEIDLELHPTRQAAGPLDRKALFSIDRQLRDRQWFEATKTATSAIHYQPLAKAGQHREYYERYFATQDEEIQRVIGLFAPLRTRQAEIWATLYTAWNDLLLAGNAEPSDEEIIRSATTEWHAAKDLIPEADWRHGLASLRQHNLTPRGTGRMTRPTGSKRE